MSNECQCRLTNKHVRRKKGVTAKKCFLFNGKEQDVGRDYSNQSN